MASDIEYQRIMRAYSHHLDQWRAGKAKFLSPQAFIVQFHVKNLIDETMNQMLSQQGEIVA